MPGNGGLANTRLPQQKQASAAAKCTYASVGDAGEQRREVQGVVLWIAKAIVFRRGERLLRRATRALTAFKIALHQ